MTVYKERRNYVSLPNVLTLVGMLVALSGVWATSAAENADTKRRVQVLEQDQQSTRQLIKDTGAEIKADVKEAKEGMNTILQELRAMQAVERERVRRGRDGS